MKNIIEVKEIYHSYKEKEVLKGISLTFEICFHVSFCNKGLSSATQFPFHTPVWL